jgi:hypothetical protein
MIFLILLIIAIILLVLSFMPKITRKFDSYQIPAITTIVVVVFVWIMYLLAISSEAYETCHYHVIEEKRELLDVGKVNVPDKNWLIYINKDGSISSKRQNAKSFDRDFKKYFRSEQRYIEDDKVNRYFYVEYHTRWGWVVPWPERNRWAILQQVVGPNGEGLTYELYRMK